MVYKYGTMPGEARAYVYRVTMVNEDGEAVELSWPAVKARCKELGIEHVPELHDPIIFGAGLIPPFEPFTKDELDMLLEHLVEGESTLDSSHIREGVVLRFENEYGTSFFKQKSYTFKVLEGITKEADVVDLEEIS